MCVIVHESVREKGGRWQESRFVGAGVGGQQVMEMQSDRNASLVHPACLCGRRRERAPEDMASNTHTHTRTLQMQRLTRPHLQISL